MLLRSFASTALLLSLTVVLAAQAPNGRSTSSDIMPFAATERTLPNGLKVVIVPTGFPNLVSIDIPVQTGSRNEFEPGKSGFAHFFEHLMFRGTPNTPPEKFRAIMTKAGARDNASTGDDRTHYYATFAKDDLDTIVALYADMFQHLAYSEADFKTEARAILGEYNKNSADPMEKLFEVQRDRFYRVHTYRHTTMGFIQDIENMPNEYEYSKVFFDRWYRPQYTTIILAGDVAADRVLPLVEKYWGGWKGGTVTPPNVPQEPAPTASQYVHVPWQSDTLPLVTVGFPGPAFDDQSKDSAAIQILSTLYFGRTSELYKKLVVNEQKVDELDVDVPASFDPSLFTVLARVKKTADTVYVRDQILSTIAEARASRLSDARVAEAKASSRYAFARTLDSTERIAAVLSRYVVHRRSFATVNNFYRTLDSITPADIQATAQKYFTDAGLIVTTLGREPLPSNMATLPKLDAVQFTRSPDGGTAPAVVPPLPTGSAGGSITTVLQKSVIPQLDVKLLFTVGSANDPVGKEGLAALTAAMMTQAGSKAMTIEQIEKALYPIAGSFTRQTDKEMTTLTARIHRDEWRRFFGIVLPQLMQPGFRNEDFQRLKEAQLNALTQDLRSNNEEELGKEELQVNIFRGTPYGHVALGTTTGLAAITLDDVKTFAERMYTRANLTVAISGDAPDEMVQTVKGALGTLPAGTATPRVRVEGTRPRENVVEILEKDTRATAISLGFPIDVTRSHADFPALSIARAALGEHRLSWGRLFQRIREVRGMNYGDYAYIEAYPGGMFSSVPAPNLARQRQIFEIWIRPVVPANSQMALRLAVFELQKLVRDGLTREEFEATRDYLMKSVYVMTARQDEQLGYALDSRWYGIGEFTSYMRDRLSKLTLDDVNGAIRRHLSADRLSVVIVTKDAAALKQALVSDAFSSIKYDGEKPAALLEEDKVVGAFKLNLAADRIRVTPIAEVFAR
ncbi:MAG TPA: pitrilysin family protein [Vicinamibacterales bacterium]